MRFATAVVGLAALAGAGTCSCAQIASADGWPDAGAAGGGASSSSSSSSGTASSAGGTAAGGGGAGDTGGGGASTCASCADACLLVFGDNAMDDRNGVTLDTSIQLDSPDDNFGNVSFMRVDGDTQTSVGLLRFDLGTLAGKTICRADLHLVVGVDGSPDDFYVTRVEEAWNENEATWVKRTSLDDWSEPGCLDDPSCSPVHEVDIQGPLAPGQEVKVILPPTLVQPWVDGLNLGISLRATTYEAADFQSSEAPDKQRPSLAVTYADSP